MYADSYRVANRILVTAALVLAGVMLVVYFRGDWVCPSMSIAKTPCLLCGCTRDFVDIYQGHGAMRNPISPWLFCFLHAELAWRLVFSFVRCRKRLAIADAVLHGALAIPLLAYLVAVNPLWKHLG